jgi:hypothetical protein
MLKFIKVLSLNFYFEYLLWVISKAVNQGQLIAKSGSGIKLPLSTYGIGGDTTFVFKNVTINVRTEKLEVEFEFS